MLNLIFNDIIICDQMGSKPLSWLLPTSYSFSLEGNIAASSNAQRRNNRLNVHCDLKELCAIIDEVWGHSEYKFYTKS